jgi:general secretion pathway protein J
MVSVGILGVIMTLIWSSTAQNLRAKERIEARDDMFHSAQVALRKIIDDVSVAFLVKGMTPGSPGAAAAGTTTAPAPSGAAAASSLKTFLIGEDRGDQDAMRFSSLSHIRLVKDSKQSDQCKVAYETAPSPDEPRKFNLLRKEDFWLDGTTDVTNKGFPIVENIVGFNVEYYDDRKGEWGKEWSSEKADWAGKLPLAVRVTLTFTDPDDDTKTIAISTAVSLPLSTGPIEM